MNERIKELYGNALDKAVPYTWHNLDHAEVEKIMKEFAELIVRDCVSIVENQGKFLRYDVLAKKIKENFEIKNE